MSFKRADKVADLIKAELSEILLRQINDPQVKEITVTGVKVTDDLRQARVFFVRMGESRIVRTGRNAELTADTSLFTYQHDSIIPLIRRFGWTGLYTSWVFAMIT